MDSLDIVEFLMDVESEFEVSLPNTGSGVFGPQSTLSDMWRALVVAQTGNVSPPVPRANDPTWLRLQRLAAERFGLPLDDVGPETKLGL